ncbi:MAG: hypothetical protein AAF220_13930 [Pseudomonadota bacterium]
MASDEVTPLQAAVSLIKQLGPGSAGRATLATVMPPVEEVTGTLPYASLIITALGSGGRLLLLLSDLAQHTINLKHTSASSLLIDGTGGLEEPLTGPRVTLIGKTEKIEKTGKTGDSTELKRFIEMHQSAGFYAGFADFNLYAFQIERAHLVAGFGKIDWIDGTELTATLSE